MVSLFNFVRGTFNQYCLRRKLLKPNGALLKEGGTIKMTELSMTLEKVAEHGSQYFYNSSFTKEMVMELQRDYGSVLTVKDFNDYSVTLRKALISDYHDLQLIGVPPPGGGAMIALVLNILEGEEKHDDVKGIV